MDCDMNNTILDLLRIGYLECRSDGTVITLNDTAYSMLFSNHGIPDRQRVPGNNLFSFHSEYRRIFDRAKSELTVRDLELALKTPAGENIEILNCLRIDEEGGGHVQVTVQDVTGVKMNRKNQWETENQLRSIIDLVPDIVYRLDVEGRITYISERITHYGYAADELLGKHIIGLVHPDDREKAQFRIMERRSGERATKFFEVRLLTKEHDAVPFEIENCDIVNSHYFSVSAEGIYIYDSNNTRHFAGTQGIARDITRRGPAENIAKLTDEKCYDILDKLHEGYYELDLDRRYKFANLSLCVMYGYSRDEIAGRSYTDFLAPECREMIERSYDDVLNGRAKNRITDCTIMRRDGKTVHAQGSISLNRDEGGTTAGYIGIVRDMTTRKKMEEELFRARKHEAIGIFSGGIAHDYNNALTTIIGNIALAKLEFGRTNEKLMEFLTDAEAGSFRVKELTQQLTSLSRGGRPVKQVVNITAMVNDVANSMMKDFSGERRLRIREDLWNVEIDEYQISHVLEYIIQNSIEAVSDDGSITVSAENVHVDKEKSHHELVLLAGDYVKITVSDNGRGISQEEMKNIFDPYYSTKELRSGMGLAISYAVMKRHNGYIDVRSSAGQGSEFYIYIPKAQ